MLGANLLERKSKKPKGPLGRHKSVDLWNLTQTDAADARHKPAKQCLVGRPLSRSNMMQTLVELDLNTAEAANVAGAVEALTFLSELATPVSLIPSKTNGEETPHPVQGYMLDPHSAIGSKRKRPVLVQRVDDIETDQCIRCPVCSRGLNFLPLDTDLVEAVGSPRLSKSLKEHSDAWHPKEPLWNALPNLGLQPSNTEPFIRTHDIITSVSDLVAQSLACAARSLLIPRQDKWAESWSRVEALALARIGSAHCYVTFSQLHFGEGIIAFNSEGKTEASKRSWIRREALRYLASLMSSVEATPPCQLWQAEHSELRRRNLFQAFFFDGRNHRQLGFIHPAVLPRSPHFP